MLLTYQAEETCFTQLALKKDKKKCEKHLTSEEKRNAFFSFLKHLIESERLLYLKSLDPGEGFTTITCENCLINIMNYYTGVELENYF